MVHGMSFLAACKSFELFCSKLDQSGKLACSLSPETHFASAPKGLVLGEAREEVAVGACDGERHFQSSDVIQGRYASSAARASRKETRPQKHASYLVLYTRS